MSDENWTQKLKSTFDELAAIEQSKKETLAGFTHFHEFIAEPAFESLARELRPYRIKASYRYARGRSIHFLMTFPGSRLDAFHYEIILPENSVELQLKLRLRGRKTVRSVLDEKEEAFLPAVAPADVLKMDKEALILDVIEHYGGYMREARTTPR